MRKGCRSRRSDKCQDHVVLQVISAGLNALFVDQRIKKKAQS